jgi:hypothetical protein
MRDGETQELMGGPLFGSSLSPSGRSLNVDMLVVLLPNLNLGLLELRMNACEAHGLPKPYV